MKIYIYGKEKEYMSSLICSALKEEKRYNFYKTSYDHLKNDVNNPIILTVNPDNPSFVKIEMNTDDIDSLRETLKFVPVYKETLKDILKRGILT